jgi:cytidine deaminase
LSVFRISVWFQLIFRFEIILCFNSVGAALLTSSGKIYSGCNIENAAYPLATCAERTALVKAVSEGEKSFQTIAITSYVYHQKLANTPLLLFSDVEIGFTGPCGSCRQILAEFGLDLDVYLINPKNESKMYKLRELLPIAFTPHDLQKPRTSHDIIEWLFFLFINKFDYELIKKKFFSICIFRYAWIRITITKRITSLFFFNTNSTYS